MQRFNILLIKLTKAYLTQNTTVHTVPLRYTVLGYTRFDWYEY